MKELFDVYTPICSLGLAPHDWSVKEVRDGIKVTMNFTCENCGHIEKRVFFMSEFA